MCKWDLGWTLWRGVKDLCACGSELLAELEMEWYHPYIHCPRSRDVLLALASNTLASLGMLGRMTQRGI